MYGLFTVLVKCIPDQALKNILEKMLCNKGVSQELNDMRIKYINGLRCYFYCMIFELNTILPILIMENIQYLHAFKN